MLKQIFIASILYILLAPAAWAATLEWRPAQIMAAPGDVVEASLWLDPDGELINALAGELVYPGQGLIPESLSDGGSIINFWLEPPVQISPGLIRFAGIVPGGWSGVLSPYEDDPAAGKILTLLLRAPASGEYQVRWQDVQALRNDGAATPVLLRTSDLMISIDPLLANNSPSDLLTSDITPPEEFTPTIARDSHLFANRWFVTFATNDLGSGIARYEIQEHPDAIPPEHGWRSATSPQVLADQRLRQYVSIRAFDHAGNKRTATLTPVNSADGYDSARLWLIIIILCFAILSYYFYSAHHRSRRMPPRSR